MLHYIHQVVTYCCLLWLEKSLMRAGKEKNQVKNAKTPWTVELKEDNNSLSCAALLTLHISCLRNQLLHILRVAYCMYYMLNTKWTIGVIGSHSLQYTDRLPRMHFAQPAAIAKYLLLFFSLHFNNKYPAGFWLWSCSALYCGKQ